MPSLFSPITITHLAIANRIAMPPMVRCAPHMPPEVVQTRGRVTPAVVEHYARRARAGVGLIVVEATCVDENGRVWDDGLNAYADEHIADLAALASAIHAAGAKAFIQLVHGGPQASPSLCRGGIAGPSAVRDSTGVAMPRELTVDEILAIEGRFADAAARAVAAGFDGVEVHGAHGYLLDSFLLKHRNLRTDGYGGDLAGRMRFLAETCRAVRERIGQTALLGCRVCVFNKLAQGFSLDDLRQLVSALEATGLDLLHLSTDGVLKPSFGEPSSVGQRLKQITPLPLIVAGGLRSPADANRAISEGHGDFAAIGTALLQDADWAMHARAIEPGSLPHRS